MIESKETKRLRIREETLKLFREAPIGETGQAVSSQLVTSWLELAWEKEDREERTVAALERIAVALESQPS